MSIQAAHLALIGGDVHISRAYTDHHVEDSNRLVGSSRAQRRRLGAEDVIDDLDRPGHVHWPTVDVQKLPVARRSSAPRLCLGHPADNSYGPRPGRLAGCSGAFPLDSRSGGLSRLSRSNLTLVTPAALWRCFPARRGAIGSLWHVCCLREVLRWLARGTSGESLEGEGDRGGRRGARDTTRNTSRRATARSPRGPGRAELSGSIIVGVQARLVIHLHDDTRQSKQVVSENTSNPGGSFGTPSSTASTCTHMPATVSSILHSEKRLIGRRGPTAPCAAQHSRPPC